MSFSLFEIAFIPVAIGVPLIALLLPLVIDPVAFIDPVFSINHDPISFSLILFCQFAPVYGVSIFLDAKKLSFFDFFIIEHIGFHLVVFINGLGVPPVEILLVLLGPDLLGLRLPSESCDGLIVQVSGVTKATRNLAKR
jgi:hypothetical protein